MIEFEVTIAAFEKDGEEGPEPSSLPADSGSGGDDQVMKMLAEMQYALLSPCIEDDLLL
jgi:hypothetical protein